MTPAPFQVGPLLDRWAFSELRSATADLPWTAGPLLSRWRVTGLLPGLPSSAITAAAVTVGSD